MTERKRILFLADINSIHTQRWVINLIAKDFEIGIFSLSAKSTTWMDDIDGLTFECYGLGQGVVRSNKRMGKMSYFSAIKDARKFCDSFTPEIVHAHYASSYGMLATRLKFPKTILSLWGSDVYEFPKRSVLHRILFKRILKSIPVVCSTSKDMAREAGKYVSKDYKITPFGIDTDVFRPIETPRSEWVIGTVKSLEDVYGIDRLIRLFARFNDVYNGETRLFIYGKGSKEDELKKLSEDLGVAEFVEFKGYVSGEDLVKAFNSLDVFVALSRQESFGVAVLEAQACGVPVLVSNVGGLPEVVGEGSGTIISGDDYERGYGALLEYAYTQDREELSSKARAFVLENYSEEVCVNKMIEVYDQI
jgi:glycosyltransferase involved in cell wall biosynthesis